jgi:hypothetical protein
MDEIWELERVSLEKHGRAFADHVSFAFLGTEPQREVARVARNVGRAGLAGNGREPREHWAGVAGFLK